MKKIGIVTIHRAHNYGAVLQAYALRRVIEEMGFTCEILDYDTERHKQIYSIKHRNKVISMFYPYDNVEKYKKFESFISDITGEEKYSSIKELQTSVNLYDVIVAGSDQIWNVNFSFLDMDVFFLRLKGIRKKIAYAASIGTANRRQLSTKKDLLKQFDSIFMREERGKQIIDNILGENITKCVLDPTLLLSKEQWLTLSSKKYKKGEYLFAYIMDASRINIAKKIAKVLGLNMIIINYDKFVWGKNCINAVNAGPKDFIDIINNASIVVTDSYHGVLFSINFNIPFYFACDKNNENNMRINDVLTLFDLQDRKIFEEDINNETGKMDSYCDFKTVNIKLEEKRALSRNMLYDSLSK